MVKHLEWPRAIVHIDIDAFFASIHQRDNPALRNRPLVVSGSTKRSVVISASYEARKYGIKSAMPLQQALRQCPDLVVVPPQRELYRSASKQMSTLLQKYAARDAIEQASIDEAYVDITPRVRRGYYDPENVARSMRRDIRAYLGLSCSIGVATSKCVAKVASEQAKPGGVIVVSPGSETEFLHDKPVNVIPGVGPKTQQILNTLGIVKCEDLYRYDDLILLKHLGKSGIVIKRMAQGIDKSPVVGFRHAKSYSHEFTFDEDINDRSVVVEKLLELCRQLCQRLNNSHTQADSITLKIKYGDFEVRQKSKKLSDPTNNDVQISENVLDLFSQELFERKPIRLVGIKATIAKQHLVDQLKLF